MQPKLNRYTEKVREVLQPLVKAGLKPRLAEQTWYQDSYMTSIYHYRLLFFSIIMTGKDTLVYKHYITNEPASDIHTTIYLSVPEEHLSDFIDWDYINEQAGYKVG